MTTPSEEQMSHADRHDLDKLARWKSDLVGSAEKGAAGLPYCAIFLVGSEDRASHDIFRRYRSAFEDLGGGFHNLVIFGQHGVSTTQVAFVEELGLQLGSVPVLAIASISESEPSGYCIELQKGERDGELDDTQAWGTALQAVRASLTEGRDLDIEKVPGVSEVSFSAGSLSSAIERVVKELGN